MKSRVSNIELLKVIAVFFILLSHSTPRYGLLYPFNGVLPDGNVSYVIDPNVASLDLHNLIIQYLTSFGQIGNALFVICSSWFLYETGRVKRSKVWFLISSTFLISISSYGFLKCLGFNYDVSALLYSIFPIATYNNWFVCCYLIFYLINPTLKTVADSLNQRRSLIFIILGLYAFSLWNMIFPSAFLYFQLVQFILIYFIVVYFKRFVKLERFTSNKALICSLIGFVGLFMHTVIINAVSVNIFHITIQQNSLSPWILIICFSSFFFFLHLKLRSNIVNFLSSLSLLVYLIDENYAVRSTLKPYFWYIYQWGGIHSSCINMIAQIVLFTFFSLTVCIVLATLYKFTDRFVISKICRLLDKFFVSVYLRIEKTLVGKGQ